MTWAERKLEDDSLRVFVEAEVARAHVELQALRAENAHLQNVIQSLKEKLIEAGKDTSHGRRRRTAV